MPDIKGLIKREVDNYRLLFQGAAFDVGLRRNPCGACYRQGRSGWPAGLHWRSVCRSAPKTHIRLSLGKLKKDKRVINTIIIRS